MKDSFVNIILYHVPAFRKSFIRKKNVYCNLFYNGMSSVFFSPFRKNWDLECYFPLLNSICFGCALQMRIVSQQLAGRKQQSQLSHCCLSHVNVFILQPRLITASLQRWPLGSQPLEPAGLCEPDSFSCPEKWSLPFIIGKHAVALVSAAGEP